MPERLTEPGALRLLREVVAERPDYVYTRQPGDSAIYCRYVQGDEPGCIVGNVLYRHGIPLAELSREEGVAADQLPAEWLDSIAAALLGRAQRVQDGGEPWRDALAEAELVAALSGITT